MDTNIFSIFTIVWCLFSEVSVLQNSNDFELNSSGHVNISGALNFLSFFLFFIFEPLFNLLSCLNADLFTVFVWHIEFFLLKSVCDSSVDFLTGLFSTFLVVWLAIFYRNIFNFFSIYKSNWHFDHSTFGVLVESWKLDGEHAFFSETPSSPGFPFFRREEWVTFDSPLLLVLELSER